MFGFWTEGSNAKSVHTIFRSYVQVMEGGGRLHYQSSLCKYGYTKDEEKYESPTYRLHPSPHTIKVYGGIWGGLCLGLGGFSPISIQ